jgi:hypothetical protein
MRECDWIVIPDKHPAIISNEVYEQVQNLLQQSRERQSKNQDTLHISGKIVKCGCCGYGLRYSGSNNPPRYHCVHMVSHPDAECHKMWIGANDLENAILTITKKQVEVITGSDGLTGFRKINAENRQIAGCENRIKVLSVQRQNCYERFMRGEIDRETFMETKNGLTAQIDDMSSQTDLLRQIARNKEAQDKVIAVAEEAMSADATIKDVVNALVEKVFVFPDNHLEIHWKFADFSKNNDTEGKQSA